MRAGGRVECLSAFGGLPRGARDESLPSGYSSKSAKYRQRLVLYALDSASASLRRVQSAPWALSTAALMSCADARGMSVQAFRGEALATQRLRDSSAAAMSPSPDLLLAMTNKASTNAVPRRFIIVAPFVMVACGDNVTGSTANAWGFVEQCFTTHDCSCPASKRDQHREQK